MNGFELSRSYFEKYGLPMLKESFSHLMPLLACGFTGSGSEHYGFDDEISRDHDFEPGFCIFLPDEEAVSRRDAFRLERAYSKLPKEYLGFIRQPLSPVGGNRHGVIRTSEFYLAAAGTEDGNLSTEQWLHMPDHALCEAINGEIYFDSYGQVTNIRQKLASMPEDVRLKRLAGSLLMMGQSGQYNYPRCIAHREPDGAQLACGEFVTHALKVLFLLNKKYMPFYKWSFRAARQLEGADETLTLLSKILNTGSLSKKEAEEKEELIEKVSSVTAEKLRSANLSDKEGSELETHAYAVNDRIKRSDIRNLHILTCV